MLTQQFRPQKFSEVLFQDLPKKVMKSIAKSPDGKPRVILLSGPFGTGKTTLAKIFAKALNCREGTGEACNKCEYCVSNLESSGIYTEYDSSIIGNVSTLRDLAETFYFSVRNDKRVILFDEAQVISREAQSALLKVTEDIPKSVWFIFATTHPEDLLPALRSRSLELELAVAPPSIIMDRVNFLSEQLGKEISEEDAELIVDRSSGHFRNCDMLFDLFLILGDDFKGSLNSGKFHFRDFIYSAINGDREEAEKALKALRHLPLAQIRADLETVLTELSHSVVKKDYAKEYLGELPELMGIKAFSIVKYYLSPWGLGAFTSDRTFEMFYWSLFAVVTQLGIKN